MTGWYLDFSEEDWIVEQAFFTFSLWRSTTWRNILRQSLAIVRLSMSEYSSGRKWAAIAFQASMLQLCPSSWQVIAKVLMWKTVQVCWYVHHVSVSTRFCGIGWPKESPYRILENVASMMTKTQWFWRRLMIKRIFSQTPMPNSCPFWRSHRFFLAVV